MNNRITKRPAHKSQLGITNEVLASTVIKAAEIFRTHKAKVKAEGTIDVKDIPVRCVLNGFNSSWNAVLIKVFVKDIEIGVATLNWTGETYMFKYKMNFTYTYACKLRSQQ